MTPDGTFTHRLTTPCGSICITDSCGGSVPFSVRKNGFDVTYESYTGRLHHTEHNYALCVPSTALKKGELYRIALDGAPLSSGCCDECTECVSGTAGGYAIAIGATDYNEWRKTEQLVAYARANNIDLHLPMKNVINYDRSEFVRYDVVRLEDCSGFRFELLDDDCDEIVFLVAWIEDNWGEGEEAVQFWTT